MTEHLSADDLTGFLMRRLTAARAESIGAHVRSCAVCAESITQSRRLSEFAEAIVFEATEDTHLEFESQIVPYVEEALGATARKAVDEHLHGCRMCRGEVEDLQRFSRVSSSPAGETRPTRWWAWAAAAVLVVTVALWTREEERPLPSAREATTSRAETTLTTSPAPTVPSNQAAIPSYDDPEWTALVATVLEQGRLPISPHLAFLQGSPGTVRGDTQAKPSRLTPTATAIDSTRPRFTWPPRANASYVVTVAVDDKDLVTSPPLRRAEWVCDRNLRRGTSYVWQVDVTHPDGRTEVLSAPPAPPARFHIISDREHQELVAATTRYPDDHLLLSVLYSRAGMRAEAERHLRLLAAREPRSMAIQRLLGNTNTRP